MWTSRESQSGQAIALFAISALFVALITFFTIATGNRIQEKIKAQAAADTAAYGLAVSQARAMNVMSLSNRAIIAEYVSSLSVAGHISWMSIYEWTFDMQAELWQKLKADKNYECAMYRYCRAPPSGPGITAQDVANWNNTCGTTASNSPVVCCNVPGQPPYCTDSGMKCYHYNCWAAACSVPNSLFDDVSQHWHTTFGEKSWTAIHTKWHEYPRRDIITLGRYARDYVTQAWRAHAQGVKAFKEYRDLLDNEAFTDGLARTVDPRMRHAEKAVGGQMGTVAQMTGAQENLKNAIETFPQVGGSNEIAPADFDVFNEVLTGTRGGGRNNWADAPYADPGMQWETQHGAADGYFEDDDAQLPGICRKDYSGPWPGVACSAAWDEGDMVPKHLDTAFGSPESDKYKGGEMMLKGWVGSFDQIYNVNTGNRHQYSDGDLGGPNALSAQDSAYTIAGFAVLNINKKAGVGYPSVDTSNSMVCLGETGHRVVNLGINTHDGVLDCLWSHAKRMAGDTPNARKGYNGYTWAEKDEFKAGRACGVGQTEVGFFRFAVDKEATFATADGRVTTQPGNPSGYKEKPYTPVNLYNQPFTYAATQVDATHDENGKPLPWDLNIGRVGGSMLKLNQRTDEKGDARGNNGDRDKTGSFTGRGYNNETYHDVRGFASGLSYYHNPTSWSEVPNLFNPYWRAKLSSPGQNALKSLKSISSDDCEAGAAMGMVNGASGNSCN